MLKYPLFCPLASAFTRHSGPGSQRWGLRSGRSGMPQRRGVSGPRTALGYLIMKKIWWVVLTILVVCVSASAEVPVARPQHLLAYTDPGSGALLLQYLTMAGLFLAFYFSRARVWLAKHLGLSQQDPGTKAEAGATAPSENNNLPSDQES